MALPITPTADLKLRYTRDETTRLYGVDLVLSPAGDLQLVAGLDRLEQDVRRWLQIRLGSYVFDVTWGDPLWAQRGRPRPTHVAELITAALAEAEDAFLRAQAKAASQGYLSTDEMLDRFDDIEVITYEQDPGRVDVLFRLVARSGNNRPAELWLPVGPSVASTRWIQPPLLVITTLPAALGPGEQSVLGVTYNGWNSLYVSADVGSVTLVVDDVPSAPSFVPSTCSPSTFPCPAETFPGLDGGTLFYTAPAEILVPGWATITVEAYDSVTNQATAEGRVQVRLVPAPALTLAFQTSTMLLGASQQLLVTYAGSGVVTLSVSVGNLAEETVVGSGTWGVTYTAPSALFDSMFVPGTGFWSGPGALVTASASDGTLTATASTTLLAP